MGCRTLACGVALALVTAAGAATPVSPTGAAAAATGRFTPVDAALLGPAAVPFAAPGTGPVAALVQLAGDPVAVQQVAAAARRTTFDATAASRALAATQAAASTRVAVTGARVTGRTSFALNALVVRATPAQLAAIAAQPGTLRVQVARVVTRDNAAAATYTGVPSAWQDLGLTGRGVTVGVIDTGLDYTHADFGGPGTREAFKANDGTVIEPGSFPTAKVVGGYDLVGDAYDPLSTRPATRIPRPDPDPLDCSGHGTHVAGTVAGAGVTRAGQSYPGPYEASTLTSTRFLVAPGVAPQASLRAYRVFGCSGASDDSVVVQAIDRAAADGVDVINMSLGSAYGRGDDLQAVAVANATAAGSLVVAASGNSGSSPFITGSPSSANEALSVAAVDAARASFPGAVVSNLTAAGGSLALVVVNRVRIPTQIEAELVDVGTGCGVEDFAKAAGKIALAGPGQCGIFDPLALGQQAGARAVVLINEYPGGSFIEFPYPGVTIPFLITEPGAGPTLTRAVGRSVTISAGPDIPNPPYGRVAGFSSGGPRIGDSAAKPDVAAPGVNIVSAASGRGTTGVEQSGTSMATPHIAGITALVAQARPTWSPSALKAAVMSTAAPSRLAGFDPRLAGTGVVQPRQAAATTGYLSTKDGLHSLSFGARQLAGDYRATRSFTVTNTSDVPVTYALSHTPSGGTHGATLTFAPASVTVPARSSREVTASLRLSAASVALLPSAEPSNGGRLVLVRGAVVATPSVAGEGQFPLRMTYLLAPQGLSDVRATAGPLAGDGDRVTGTLRLTNRGVHAGTAQVYAWLLGDPSGDVPNPDVPDVISVGVQSLPGRASGLAAGDRLLVFAVNQARPTSTQSTLMTSVLLDTDGDGTPDYAVQGVDRLAADRGEEPGRVVAATVRLADDAIIDVWSATAPLNRGVLELPVRASALGLRPGQSRVGVSVLSQNPNLPNATDQDSTATATFDAYATAVSTGDQVTLTPHGTGVVPLVAWRSRAAAQQAKGWLVVTPDDRSGPGTADTVALDLP